MVICNITKPLNRVLAAKLMKRCVLLITCVIIAITFVACSVGRLLIEDFVIDKPGTVPSGAIPKP